MTSKMIYKYNIPMLNEGTELTLSGPLLPHIEVSALGVSVWAEVGKHDDVKRSFHIVVTGRSFPVEWEWIATGSWSGFVAHLYEEV